MATSIHRLDWFSIMSHDICTLMCDPTKTDKDHKTASSAGKTNEADEYERHQAEAFESLRRLHSCVGSSAIREALAGSFMICGDEKLRREYDGARKELDAFLAALDGSDAAVHEPDNFVPSPDVSEREVQRFAATVIKEARSKQKPSH